MAQVNQPRSYQFWSAIAATPGTFNLDAGVYALTLHATTWGTAQLMRILPGVATPVPVAAALTADGQANVTVPAGVYELVLAGVAGMSGEIAKIASGS